MRAGFGGDQAAVVGEQLGFGAGRDVQHVEAMVVAVGQIDRAARGDEGGRVVANAGVVGDVDVPLPRPLPGAGRGVGGRRWRGRSFRPRSGR